MRSTYPNEMVRPPGAGDVKVLVRLFFEPREATPSYPMNATRSSVASAEGSLSSVFGIYRRVPSGGRGSLYISRLDLSSF